MKKAKGLPIRTIERMVLYMRLLTDLQMEGQKTVYSHDLAKMARNTPAQLRRDVMLMKYNGNPHVGYDVKGLLNRIKTILECNREHSVALAGIGNMGRAILSSFTENHPELKIEAAFDSDENKVNRVISGCKCYPVSELTGRVKELGITVGIIAVPGDQAQSVADAMTAGGVTGILNFAPVPVHVPENVYLDCMDIAGTLEKVVFFSGLKK